MRLVIVATLLAVALGCGKRSENTTAKCGDAARQGVDAMVQRAKERIATAQLPPDIRAKMEERTKKLDELAPRLRAVITNRCVDDKWPADVIACYEKVTSMDDMRDCRSKLAAEQQAKLQKDELDVYGGVMGPPGFGSAATPPSPEVARLQAELNELNAQLADAVKKAAGAATEADRSAAQAVMQELQTKMTAKSAELDAARAKPQP